MKLKSLLLGLVLAFLWVAAAAGEPAAFYKPEEFSGMAPDDPGVWHAAGDEAGVPAPAGRTDVYNPSDVDPGWRSGIVILMDDGSVRYGEMHRNQQDTVRATVPEGADRVIFVVVGAADRAVPNPWDEDERTDFQMPYRIRINSTGDVDGH